MLLQAQRAEKVEFLTYEEGQQLPIERIVGAIYASLRSRHLDKVAVMGDAEELKKLKPLLDAEWLDPIENFHWSGTQRTHSLKKVIKRFQLGDYESWFTWFMRFQRFRAFHVVVMLDPLEALADEEMGGYLNGLLARLAAKVVHRVIVVQTRQQTEANAAGEPFRRAALMAMLYGTRLSFEELAATARIAPVPLGEEALSEVRRGSRFWVRRHARYELTDVGKEFLEGMRPPVVRGDWQPISPKFVRKERTGPRASLPDEMLERLMMQDLAEEGWVTPYGESAALAQRIGRLAGEEGSDIWTHFEGRDVPTEEVDQAMRPSPGLLRQLLKEATSEGRLETRTWYREVGRPTTAYFLPGKAPFFEERCGQCAFYVPAKRSCRLWWLVDKKRRFFAERWKEAGSRVTPFEIHKMKHSWRIGPHSSACPRFIDKKRDHLRKAVPSICEICGEPLRAVGKAVVCQNCRTKYVKYAKWGGKEKVMVQTAYEHEYNRLYHDITGGDAGADYQEVRREIRSKLPDIMKGKVREEDVDALADELPEPEPEPPRVWPKFDRELQEKVDRLAQTTDVAKRFSIAMAQSAINATRRVGEIAKLDSKEVALAVAQQEKYLARIDDASPSQLLTYEALIMNQYWKCYRLAMGRAQLWFGPRKKGRFVSELVWDQAGRARGYTAVDAAINFLHQRRLRQAERINAEVGFPGACDGFLHREHHNSRGIGLLLDMIDPFKFADREELLVLALNGGISWVDFRLERDRRGSTFYYPSARAEAILNQAGADADELVVLYKKRSMRLSEALKESAVNIEVTIEGIKSAVLEPFEFEVPEAQ